MSRAVEEQNRRLLRARDAMDRAWAKPLDVETLARIACVSEAHFIRTFKATFGEAPHRYLQRRRVERSMFLLRETERSVTEICLDVGFTSLGTFSRTFREIVGVSPSVYRRSSEPIAGAVPDCFAMAALRPSSFGEARASEGRIQGRAMKSLDPRASIPSSAAPRTTAGAVPPPTARPAKRGRRKA